MMSTIDGRLLPDRWTEPAAGLDRDELIGHYDEAASRIQADGWLVGRKTMEEFAAGAARKVKATGEYPRTPYVADRKGRNVAVAIDPQGKLHYGQDHARGDHVIAVLGERVSNEYLAELREDGVSYLFAGPDGRDLRQAMDTLGDVFGIKTLLLEGGGNINGAFLQARLIDEISLLVYPGIDGLAGVPSVFEYLGGADERPAAGQALRHLATETLKGGVVWLRYRIEKAGAAG